MKNIKFLVVFQNGFASPKDVREFQNFNDAVEYAKRYINDSKNVSVIKMTAQGNETPLAECVWDKAVDTPASTEELKSLSYYDKFSLARKEGIDAISILIGDSIEYIAEQQDDSDDENSHLLFREYVSKKENYKAVASIVDYVQEHMDQHSYGYIDDIVDAVRKLLFIDHKKIDEIRKKDVIDKLEFQFVATYKVGG